MQWELGRGDEIGGEDQDTIIKVQNNSNSIDGQERVDEAGSVRRELEVGGRSKLMEIELGRRGKENELKGAGMGLIDIPVHNGGGKITIIKPYQLGE